MTCSAEAVLTAWTLYTTCGKVRCLVMRSHRSALTSSCLSREILRVSSNFWLPCHVQAASRCAGFSEWRRMPLMLAHCNEDSGLTAGLNKGCLADVEAIWAPLPIAEGIYSTAENWWGLSLNAAQFLSLSHTLCKILLVYYLCHTESRETLDRCKVADISSGRPAKHISKAHTQLRLLWAETST